MLMTDFTSLEGAKFHTKLNQWPVDNQQDHLYLALIELHAAVERGNRFRTVCFSPAGSRRHKIAASLPGQQRIKVAQQLMSHALVPP
jgi:hypothetical protein